MRPLLAYLDTSFIGGLLDKEFAEESGRVMGLIEEGLLRACVSTVVTAELLRAPRRVVEMYATRVSSVVPVVEVSDDVESLLAAYFEHGAAKRSAVNDARHIAAATVFSCDLVVSWNFKDLVNIRSQRAFEAVNLLMGFRPVRIVSPMEVIL
jgi:predicted nucleic acid-binding protein